MICRRNTPTYSDEPGTKMRPDSVPGTFFAGAANTSDKVDTRGRRFFGLALWYLFPAPRRLQPGERFGNWFNTKQRIGGPGTCISVFMVPFSLFQVSEIGRFERVG